MLNLQNLLSILKVRHECVINYSLLNFFFFLYGGKRPAYSTYEVTARNYPGHAGRKLIFNFDQKNNDTYLQSRVLTGRPITSLFCYLSGSIANIYHTYHRFL